MLSIIYVCSHSLTPSPLLCLCLCLCLSLSLSVSLCLSVSLSLSVCLFLSSFFNYFPFCLYLTSFASILFFLFPLPSNTWPRMNFFFLSANETSSLLWRTAPKEEEVAEDRSGKERAGRFRDKCSWIPFPTTFSIFPDRKGGYMCYDNHNR